VNTSTHRAQFSRCSCPAMMRLTSSEVFCTSLSLALNSLFCLSAALAAV
jgi:hypothetical protein